MKVGILSMEQFELRPFNSVGSSRIRARWLVNHWDEADEFIYGQEYDAVIYQKVYWKRHMQLFEGLKIFDLCDKDWPERPVVETAHLVDAIVTSTEPLAQELREMVPGKRVVCIPDRVDLSEVKRLKFDYGGGKIKTALWYGYFHNFEIVKPSLYDLGRLGIKLTVVSDQHPVVVSGWGVEVESRPYRQEKIYEWIAEHDVVLNPQGTEGKWRLKSNNKTIIAWAVGAPVAHSLRELLSFQDPDSRREEAKRRLSEVKSEWDVRLSVEEYRRLIRDIIRAK